MSKSNGMKSQLALLAMAMIAGGFDPQIEPASKISYAPKQPIIPKGCKEYWFDKDGCYPNWAGRNDVVFKCVAATEKSAIRKFNKWESKSK